MCYIAPIIIILGLLTVVNAFITDIIILKNAKTSLLLNNISFVLFINTQIHTTYY